MARMEKVSSGTRRLQYSIFDASFVDQTTSGHIYFQSAFAIFSDERDRIYR